MDCCIGLLSPPREQIRYSVVVQLTGNTKTTKGLQIRAQIDYRTYHKGMTVEATDFNTIAITKNAFHGEWNYTISPVVVFEVES